MRHILDLTRLLTVRPQKKAMDLLKANAIVTLKSALRDMQTDIDNRHRTLYEGVAPARRVSV